MLNLDSRYVPNNYLLNRLDPESRDRRRYTFFMHLALDWVVELDAIVPADVFGDVDAHDVGRDLWRDSVASVDRHC